MRGYEDMFQVDETLIPKIRTSCLDKYVEVFVGKNDKVIRKYPAS